MSLTPSNTLRFMAFGLPQPKGSARAFVPKGWTRAVVTSDNPKNKGWQQIVAGAAQTALEETGGRMLTGPISLVVDFFLPKPKSTPKSVKAHLKKPDLDKLVRSVKDALTKVAWEDDSQVVMVTATKMFAPAGYSPAARVEIFEIPPPFANYPTTIAPRLSDEEGTDQPHRTKAGTSADF